MPTQQHHHKTHDKFHGAHPENVRRRKIVSIVSLAGIVIAFGLITYFVGLPLVRQFRDDPENFRAYVQSFGPWAPLLMMGVMALQIVVAFIPGEPFELAAGFIFGWLPGALWCLLGAAGASALVFLAVRKWGVKVAELFFPREKITRFSFLQNEKKLDLLVFILFLIPGSPKDLLTYLIGLTPMKLGTFLLITTLARIPSVVSSTVTGSLVQQGSHTAAIITYAVTGVVSVICILWYRRMSKQEKMGGAQTHEK